MSAVGVSTETGFHALAGVIGSCERAASSSPMCTAACARGVRRRMLRWAYP